MKMKKVWALLVSLMLVASMALPVALAVSDDQGASAAAVSSEEGTPPAEEQVEQKKADPKPDAEPEQDDQESDSQEQDGKESGENQCTCGAAEGEAHAADCPLYEKPEADKADENAALYQKFLAAKTMEEANALYNGLSKEEVTAFRTWLEENNKLTALEQHLSAITPEGEPVTMPIVSFTKVGPLLAAPARRARMMRAAADQDDTGIVLNKSAKSLGNGNYQITLEAYATGATTVTTSADPADIVLVLDVSGSMDDPMNCKEVYSSNLNEKNNYYIYIWSNGNWNWQEVTWNESWGYYYDDYFGTERWESVTPKDSNSDNNWGHIQFYSGEKKITALKTAVNGFINNVAKQSSESQIALVKFAGGKRNDNRVGDDTYQEDGHIYNYTQVVRSLTPASKSGELTGAVNKLEAGGATSADYGMQYAQSIISGAANDGKKKVVIMFTDGEPNHSSGFVGWVASDTISASKSMKDADTTVYTIGVFEGANGTPVNSWNGVSDTNKYMHLVSSNYKYATAMGKPGTATYPDGDKSYFLSAGSASELSSIFQKISQEVGGSTSNLDADATIKDIVTPYFNMPDKPSKVAVYTAKSMGNTNSWEDPEEFTEGKVTLDSENNTVSVSGFSYRGNWCGTSSNGFHNGKKLIIQFNVTAKDGFLGGNDVPTNVETSGIYDKEDKAVKYFKEVPTVNVPIKEVKVTAEDKNVYLLGSVTTDQLKTGATVTVKCGDKCGKVKLDLSKANENYGLADWQNKYVDITVEMKDKDGNAISTDGLKDLTADTTYTVSVAVKPKYDGKDSVGTPATEQSGINTPAAKINVFKPELTFKDSEAYYGAEVPDLKGNLTMTEWKHNGTVDTAAAMTGEKPELTITRTPDADKVKDNKINTKQDVGVDVTVTLNNTNVTDKTTFQHTNCTGQTCTLPEGKEFLIHIKTCTLTIKKTGGKDNESYVFDVYKDGEKDGEKYSEVTIWGNGTETLSELPVGTYTIREDTGWSWRFTPKYGAKVTLSAARDKGEITCTNTKDEDKWINGFSTVMRNIFDVATN